MARRLVGCFILLAFTLFTGPASHAQPILIACVGDSITVGAGIANRKANCYPAQLDRILGPRFAVTNRGVNGATLLKKGDLPYWQLDQFVRAKQDQPNIVVIKLGTNDTKAQNWQHHEEFIDNYIELIRAFQSLDSKPIVYICYPIPVFPAHAGINDETIREIIPLIDEVAQATGVRIIDLNTPFKGRPELVHDKLHPNAEGAKLIAQTVARTIGYTSDARLYE